MAFKSKKKFEYKARDPEKLRQRATAGGNREGFLADGVKVFSPKEGNHTVRILPPTWDEPEHYGFDVFAHYNVGVDGGAYLCLKRMKDEKCAICTERARAERDNDDELEEALKPRQRVACWVIDRDNEKEGPLMWLMPWGLDKEIAQQGIDKKTKEVYNIDDDTEGYDVSFERQGKGLTTKYVGVQLERRSSPISDDDDAQEEWLTFIKENPIPDQLVYQDEERLEEIVGDGLTAPKSSRDRAKKKEDDDEKKPRARLHSRKEEKEDEEEEKPSKPTRSSRKKIDTNDLDWKAVHEMEEKEIIALAEQEDIDIEEAEELEQAADMICEALEISKPKLGLKKRLGK